MIMEGTQTDFEQEMESETLKESALKRPSKKNSLFHIYGQIAERQVIGTQT